MFDEAFSPASAVATHVYMRRSPNVNQTRRPENCIGCKRIVNELARRAKPRVSSGCAQVAADRDPLAARAWRRLLMLCGPSAAGMWIEWREDRELTLIIAVALTKARLARRLTRSTHQPPD